MDPSWLTTPQETTFEYVEIEEGSWHRRGPDCPGCQHPGVGGVIFRGATEDGYERCAFCGHELKPDSYGPRQDGPKVRVLFPPDSDSIADNPYLNPGVDGGWDDTSLIWTAPTTDMGNAMRLAALFGERIRYVNELGFLIYDGRRWLRDNVGAMERFAKATIWEMLHCADTAVAVDKKELAKLQTHAFTSQSAGKIAAMVNLCGSEPRIAARISDFDQHPWLFNVRNGIVDLTTGQLLPHDPALNITQVSNINYDPDAQCPRWTQFLLEVCNGNQDLVDYLHRAIGYTLTGETTEEKIFFVFGDGANGKSKMLETLRRLFGDYAAHLPFEAFLNTRNGRPESHFAHLPGKRFVTASEAGEGRSWNEEMLKHVTGGDTIRGEYKYKDSFEFKPVCKIWLAANDRPVVHGTNAGIWRRFHMVPFQVDFRDSGDHDLEVKLRDELPGILAWAVRGARRWYELRGEPGDLPGAGRARDGLRPPAVITESLEEYKSDNDVLGRFVGERCILEPTYASSSSIILTEYNEWAKRNHERPITATMLGSRLRKWRAGILKKVRGPDGRIEWQGLRIVVFYAEEGRNGLDRY